MPHFAGSDQKTSQAAFFFGGQIRLWSWVFFRALHALKFDLLRWLLEHQTL